MTQSSKGAPVAAVDEGSPASDVGFEAGCLITAVDGNPVRDIIDWRWLTSDEIITISYVDNDGDTGEVVLEREPDEDWGFSFDGAVFDGTRTCVNACKFCFMRQLPKGLRGALSLRDDDFRLSFLDGTFVTLTNLIDDDIERIIEQRLTPLRVSLHAVDPQVRASLIGKNADAGIVNLQRLLDAGIEFDAQIVLVPDVNDGDVLEETLAWAYARPGIKTVGIVPLGFTKHQDWFHKSFDAPEDALRVIEQIAPWQQRAFDERGEHWVYAADEFYRNAYGERVLDALPDEGFYGDFSMYEDGIGIIRSAVDAFEAARESGAMQRCADALASNNMHAWYLCGEAMTPYVNQLFRQAGLEGLLDPIVVPNDFFGGNVNVTGLLCGVDVARAITHNENLLPHPGHALKRDSAEQENRGTPHHDFRSSKPSAKGIVPDADEKVLLYFIPSIIFNVDGLTLDGWTLDDIRAHVGPEIGPHVFVAPPVPINYMEEIARVSEEIRIV